MALQIVNSVGVRPDRIGQFQECVAELAAAAVDRGEPWKWTAHQTLFGETTNIHFASVTESFEELQQRGTVQDLWHRVLGDERGGEGFRRANECLHSAQQTVSIDRQDLSYEAGLEPGTDYPFAVVTSIRARPGHADGAEELIRKVAEAIPKVDDPARLISFQVVIGELNGYWTVRPLGSLAEIDRQLPAPDLLTKAFGPAEGGLIWRSGSEDVLEARREIMASVEELSNPQQL